MISWKSRKQQCVASSSCEAEYVALASTVQESIYLKQMLGNIDGNFQSGSSLIYEDNQCAMLLQTTLSIDKDLNILTLDFISLDQN